MKHVYPTNEIAHLWMHKTQPDARNQQGNFYFENETIYSYGSHFPIARHVQNVGGQSAILLTTRSHSVTTSRHISDVRQAIGGHFDANDDYVSNMPIWHVYDVTRDTKAQLEKEWPAQIKELAESVLTKKHIQHKTRAQRWDNLLARIDTANAFAEFFGSKKRFAIPASMNSLADELKAESKRQAAANKRAEAKRQREAKARMVSYRVEHAEELQRWIAGEDIYAPYNFEEAYLRLVRARNMNGGHEVETSKGARVPLSHVLRVLPMVKAIITAGRTYKANGHTIHLGHYQLDEITAEGEIIAGCHRIARSEFERFAAILEALPATPVTPERNSCTCGYIGPCTTCPTCIVPTTPENAYIASEVSE